MPLRLRHIRATSYFGYYEALREATTCLNNTHTLHIGIHGYAITPRHTDVSLRYAATYAELLPPLPRLQDLRCFSLATAEMLLRCCRSLRHYAIRHYAAIVYEHTTPLLRHTPPLRYAITPKPPPRHYAIDA